MAKVQGPLFSVSAHGSLAKTLTYQQQAHAGAVVRKWAFPRLPPSERQIWQRKLYGYGVAAWRALTAVEREKYTQRASSFGLLGFNLFLREWLAVPPWLIGLGEIGKVKIG